MNIKIEPCTVSSFGQVSLIGSSEATKAVKTRIHLAASRLKQFSVLITGESGTGKELVARSIHCYSDRAQKPFIAVNCSAIPESLAESLLFGHLAGAFTDAINDQNGYFQQAHPGTLFLDEIGDLSPAIQVKILRAIEYREVYSVGSSEPIQVNTRIIAGTNKPISDPVYRERNGFRDDLYYRLAGFEIEIPPLRFRKEEIPELIRYFHSELIAENASLSRVKIPVGVMREAAFYDWPGNIRELKHETQKAILLADEVVEAIPVRKIQTGDGNLMKLGALIQQNKSDAEIMQELNVPRTTFYRWKQKLRKSH